MLLQLAIMICCIDVLDATKLRSALEPARSRVVEAIKKTKDDADDAGLLKRVDDAVEKTISYFKEIKTLVS